MSSITDGLSEFIAGDRMFDDEVRELARRHVLDTLASVVACRDLEPAVVARRYAQRNSGAGGTVTMLGTSAKASLVDAVFAGAMTGHGAEINDFMPSVFVQPGPSIAAVALGVAEDRDLAGRDVVRSVVIGYELAARMPRALGTGNLRAAGLANHGVGPVFGSGAAAASLLALSAGAVADLLSCCAQQASGSWQWMLDVEHMEKAFVFAGMGARNGLQAALLVEAGYRGVPNVVDDPAAWFTSTAFQDGDDDLATLVDGLDKPTSLHDAAFKRYPAGGPTQPALAAVLDLIDEVDREDITQVIIRMPGRADVFRDAAMPALNLRYLTAIILIDGHLDFQSAQSLERLRHDEAVVARMATVDVVHDPDQETGTGRDRAESAHVTVTTRSGAVLERFVGHVRGYPTHPMDRDDVEDKARDLMGPHLGADRTGRVIDACRSLDRLDRAAELVSLVAR